MTKRSRTSLRFMLELLLWGSRRVQCAEHVRGIQQVETFDQVQVLDEFLVVLQEPLARTVLCRGWTRFARLPPRRGSRISLQRGRGGRRFRGRGPRDQP